MSDTKMTNPKGGAGPEADPAKRPALYDRFAEGSRELFERGQKQGHEAWGKAGRLSGWRSWVGT